MVLFLLIVIAALLAILVLANDTARALLTLVVQGAVCLAILAALGVGVLMFVTYVLSSPEAFDDAAFGIGALAVIGGIGLLIKFTEGRLQQTAAGQRIIGGINSILGATLILVFLGFGVVMLVAAVAALILGQTQDITTVAVFGLVLPALFGWIAFAIAKQIRFIRPANGES